MTDNRTDGLDDAIRSLVARAVADAPPAPVIDEQTIAGGPIVRSIGSAPSARNRWIVGGIAALTTAAAVIAIALVARPDSAEAPAPATLPPATDLDCPEDRTTLEVAIEAFFAQNGRFPESQAELAGTFIRAEIPTYEVAGGAEPVRVPGVPCPGSEVAPSAAPTTVLPGSTIPATTSVDEDTAPPTSPAPPAAPEIITIAGDDGIQIDTGDALTDALVGEPVTAAVRMPDGRIFFQYRSPDQTNVMFTPAPDGDPPGIVPMPAGFPGRAVLHDAAVVDGEVVLLVESSPGNCVGPDDCIGSVWAVWPDREDGVMLDEQNVWEAAWTRISLSNTGLAVGTFSAEVSVSLWSVALPGTDVSPVDSASIGVERVTSDCNTCPRAFTIDRSGQHVGWLQTSDDGSLTITVHSLAEGWTFTYDIPDASDLPTFGSLDIGAIESPEGGPAAGKAIINDTDPTSAIAAHVYDLSSPGGEPIVIGKPASRMAFGY